jgi:hypothetical protein
LGRTGNGPLRHATHRPEAGIRALEAANIPVQAKNQIGPNEDPDEYLLEGDFE